MKKIISLVVAVCLLTGIQSLHAQPLSDNKQQFAYIGNFSLENGLQIMDCKIGYRTFGKLNEQRSNVVICLTGWTVNSAMMQMFGAGRDVDTTKFHLIIIDALGNGVSSSPSNSIKQPKTLFPKFSIRDMVNAQYKMLTEKMNIQHLVAVIGGSMGGIQALQWAVSYPSFMDKIVAVEGTPKLTPYDLLWANTYVEAVTKDPAYNNGNYTTNPVLPMASHIVQLIITTPEFLYNTIQADSFYTSPAWNETFPPGDHNDNLWQLKACIAHDITASTGGSLENAAKIIKAKILMINNKQDHTINAASPVKFAAMVNAKLIVMDSGLGHMVFDEKSTLEATKEFLSE